MTKIIYLVGSLRNPNVPQLANDLRKEGFEVFDDWFAPGPEADDFWKKYSQGRKQTYKEALNSWAGKHIFEFDKYHLDRADIGVMMHPAGKSGHLELGYLIGSGKPGIIYWPDGEPPQDRWDVMIQFARPVFSYNELIEELNRVK